MKLIKHGQTAANLKRVLADHQLSWASKGVYAQLIQLPNHTHLDLIEFSTHASDGLAKLKANLSELQKYGYLVIYNKLLIIKSKGKNTKQIQKSGQTTDLITRHETQVSNELLRNQWLIIWHHDDAKVTKALAKLAKYLNPAMVLYGIQISKQKCHSYRESLPYLNRLIMKWKRHGLTSVGQTQRWRHQRTLRAKPWNSEIKSRIFGSKQRTMINNTPLRKGIPDAFKKHHK